MAGSFTFSGNTAVVLDAGKTDIKGASKTTDTDKFGWKLYNVYPKNSSITDNYKRMKIEVKVSKNTIMEKRVIYEGESTTYNYSKYFDLKKNNYLVVTMEGNDATKSAKADIYLNFY